MWKAAVVTLTLLVMLVGRVRSTEGHPSFYGVKLCGREFIRAVIFTCGGSRWKRSIGDSGIISDESLDPWSTPQLSGVQQPSETQNWKAGLMDDGSTGSLFSRFARSPISEEVLEALRSADRKGRDVVVGLSNACCKWGCSKSEISSLC
ncbi:hypothetical protein NHX12_018653 [Muraenolepis orangiensis]|uniref:Relaxin-3 n=1 Tax=Muraenolepis orangiensis TaxID=630683 RepID=A0A9Q0IY62_9TELE|nr:hypothetical protein NHX12_018653 [Muraenolepis orangiensis]